MRIFTKKTKESFEILKLLKQIKFVVVFAVDKMYVVAWTYELDFAIDVASDNFVVDNTLVVHYNYYKACVDLKQDFVY
jgi:hypothetical protein